MEWLANLLGDGLTGGLLGFAPKVFEFVDKRQERKQQLKLSEMQYKAEASGKAADERVAKRQSDNEVEIKRLDAYIASVESSTKRASTDADSAWFKLPDAWNTSVRPFIATSSFLVVAWDAVFMPNAEVNAFVANVCWLAITWYFCARDIKYRQFGGSPEKAVPEQALLRAFGPVKKAV